MTTCPHCECWPDHPNNKPCCLCNMPRWYESRKPKPPQEDG